MCWLGIVLVLAACLGVCLVACFDGLFIVSGLCCWILLCLDYFLGFVLFTCVFVGDCFVFTGLLCDIYLWLVCC